MHIFSFFLPTITTVAYGLPSRQRVAVRVPLNLSAYSGLGFGCQHIGLLYVYIYRAKAFGPHLCASKNFLAVAICCCLSLHCAISAGVMALEALSTAGTRGPACSRNSNIIMSWYRTSQPCSPVCLILWLSLWSNKTIVFSFRLLHQRVHVVNEVTHLGNRTFWRGILLI